MKSSTVRIGKRIMAVMLSLMMVVGIFAGMKLDVKAAGNTYSFSGLKVDDTLYDGDKITFESNKLGDSYYSQMKITICIQWENSNDNMHDNTYTKSNRRSVSISSQEHNGKKYSKFVIKGLEYSDSNKPNEVFYIKLTPYDENKNDTSSESEGAASSPVSTPSHTCNFQWVTTIDPTTGADGLEEYKCAGCGVVKESHSIPASVAAVKDFYGKVKDAPANGTVTYDSGKLYTISDYLLKKMSERSDVAVTVNFEYQNAKYELTFPAGTDFTPVLTDEDTMYGYLGVAAKLGLTVAAK